VTPAVVVVGGGPAGLATALVLGRAGVQTLLCERSSFPVDKPCGEGLLPSAVEKLAHFGVEARDLARVGRPLAGVRYTSFAGVRAEAALPRGGAFGLRRTALSLLLYDQVRALPTVQILSGSDAEVRLAGLARPEVWVAGERIQPQLVIGADGLASRVRREMRLATRFEAPARFGVRQHFALDPWTEHVEVYFGRSREAYVTPLRDGVNVALLWEPDGVKLDRSAPLVPRLLAAFPALAERLRGAASDRARASGPFHQHVEERGAEGALLVGDAAGYVDALTGEGVGLALAQAEVLERTLVPRLASADPAQPLGARELEPARRALAAVCRPHRRFTRWLLALSRRPALFEPVIRLLARDAELFRHFVAASGGARPPWRLPLGSALGLPALLLDELRRDHSRTVRHALRNTP